MNSGNLSLSGDSLLQSIRDQFKLVPDHRDPSKVKIELLDFLMSGLAIFVLKFPSLLKFEEEMRERKLDSHLSPLFKFGQVPSDTHLRYCLDEVSPDSLAPIFKKLLSRVQRANYLRRFQFINGKYLLCLDGTQFFSSTKVHCESCLVKRVRGDADGDSSESFMWSHQMLAGCIVHPDQECVIPIAPEPILRGDGSDKNDCERSALKRLLERLRRDHPRLPLIVTGDALHATGPNLRDLIMHQMDFILAVKPGSHEKLFKGVDQWEERGKVAYYSVEEEFGDKVKKKRIHQFRFVNGILLNHANTDLAVNFVEHWEITQWVSPKGKLEDDKKHFSWITNLEVTESNIVEIMRGGRGRWKIENETFNTLKNQGYEFEHNFGHGKKNLSNVFAYLMFIAFLFDQLQMLGCEVFQKVLRYCKRKSYMWEDLRSLFRISYILNIVFESWEAFLHKAIGPPKKSESS